jgi:hypothetical protein
MRSTRFDPTARTTFRSATYSTIEAPGFLSDTLSRFALGRPVGSPLADLHAFGRNHSLSAALLASWGQTKKETTMARDEHNMAAEHHENAAKAHRSAAEHHGKGDHAKGQEHAAAAKQHSQTAHQHSDQAHSKSQQQK